MPRATASRKLTFAIEKQARIFLRQGAQSDPSQAWTPAQVDRFVRWIESPAYTRVPASCGSGHGASTIARLPARQVRGILLDAIHVASTDNPPAVSSSSRISRDRMPPPPRTSTGRIRICIGRQHRMVPGDGWLLAQEQHVVMVGVPGRPHRHQLDQCGSRACSRAIRGPRERGRDLVRVSAIDGDAGDAVTGGFVSKDSDDRLLRNRGRELRLVVLDPEDRRQRSRRAEVDRLVPFTERRTALANERDPRDTSLSSRENAMAMPAMDSMLIDSSAIAGRIPIPSRRCADRRRPSVGRRFDICASRTIRLVSGPGRIASATPR